MSKLVCTMPCRNEEWIIGLSARAVLLWCDLLVVGNHRSTDESRRILEEIAIESGGRLLIVDFEDEQWEEMKHRQALLTIARQYDATHIVMVDADEVLTGNLLPTIRGYIEALPKGVTMCLPWLCLRGGIDRYHIDGTWGRAEVSMAFLDEPRCHWAARDGYDFHHRHPMGRPYVPVIPTREGGLMHLQFVSDRRLRAKQALYKILEVIRWPGKRTVDEINRMYNVAVYGYERPNGAGCGGLAKVPYSWWNSYSGSTNAAIQKLPWMIRAAEPWQEVECQRLYLKYGPEPFEGLDLFGVVP
jgi:hypothetical protein